MNKKSFRQQFFSVTAMLIATIIWGLAFSAQSSGMRFTGAMVFVALRSIVGGLALIAVVACMDLIREKRCSFWGRAQSRRERITLLIGGISCGVIIGSASIFQQLGLQHVSAGKTGFLTALYIIFVPLLGIFFRRKTSWLMLAGTFLALFGTYLLCGGADTVGYGEWMVIICAVLFAGHIIVIDHYAGQCDCVRLSCIQFMTAAAVATAAALLFREKWQWQAVYDSMFFWMFCGVGSSAIAFTLQIVAQKYLHPVTAALLMSMESVFAVVGGWLFLNEKLSGREIAGCLIILLAVIIAQLPEKRLKKSAG